MSVLLRLCFRNGISLFFFFADTPCDRMQRLSMSVFVSNSGFTPFGKKGRLDQDFARQRILKENFLATARRKWVAKGRAGRHYIKTARTSLINEAVRALNHGHHAPSS